MPPPSTRKPPAPEPPGGAPEPAASGAPEPAAKRPRQETMLRVASWNVDVARLGPKMTHVACDVARMLQHVDIVLLQELGAWDKPLSEPDWAAFVKAIVSKKADEWDARKNGHYAILAKREDPRGGCGSTGLLK